MVSPLLKVRDTHNIKELNSNANLDSDTVDKDFKCSSQKIQVTNYQGLLIITTQAVVSLAVITLSKLR